MNNLLVAFSISPVIGPRMSLSEILYPYELVLIVAFLGSLLATPLARRLAFRFNVLDIPDGTVKTHRAPTAYLGGVAVLVGFVVAALFGDWLVGRQIGPGKHSAYIYAIVLGAVVACFVGLVDDIKDLKPHYKLLGQFLCSLFLVAAGIIPNMKPFFTFLGLELPDAVCRALGILVVLFSVLGATNSLNLLDGLDGLCTGVTAIITLGFLGLTIHLATWSRDQFDMARIVTAFALAGAALGFLVFNRHPAKIFLGDAGSVMLGFVIAAMMMLFATRTPRWWLASLVIFGLPILDTGTALIRRALNKRPLFLADRGHIYDQMIDRGIPLQKTVAINYLLASLYGVLGLTLALFFRTRHAVWMDVLIAVISFAIVAWRGYFRMAGLRGAS